MASAAPTRTIYLALMILLLGAFLRLNGVARDSRLHPDEALYADLSRRVGIWGDWQLHDTPVDKPPLFFFMGGAFMRVLGDSEFTVRLPNALASIIGLAAIFALARRLAGDEVALMTMLLMALSPMDIAFAISGFTDTQMTVWMLVALWLMTIHHPGWSGLAFGLSVAVKPATLWFLPLILLIHQRNRRIIWQWARGFLLLIVLISLWDQAGSLGSFWQLGADHYDGRRFIRGDELWPRARVWWAWLRYALPGSGILLGGLLLTLMRLRRDTATSCPGEKHRWRFVTLMLAFTLTYLALHWWIAFNLYDRYLLPIAPLLAMLAAYGIAEWLKTRQAILLAVMIALLVIGFPLAWKSSLGKTVIASDDNRHNGIDHLAATMNRDFAGEIFYEHWLGWELRYYLGAQPQVLLLYFESAGDLAAYAADEVARIPVPRYFVGPKDEATSWIDTIKAHGIRTEVVYDDGKYVIFSLDE
jgi:4-amino-4-deoxy-L-arabinose transferase-like glycosyltransferase